MDEVDEIIRRVQANPGLYGGYGLRAAELLQKFKMERAQTANEALERAAKVCEDVPCHWEQDRVAAAIRALKT